MTEEIAVSLGTSNTSIFMPGSGIVLCEPSVIAYNGDPAARKVRAVGKEAAANCPDRLCNEFRHSRKGGGAITL